MKSSIFIKNEFRQIKELNFSSVVSLSLLAEFGKIPCAKVSAIGHKL
jgi:hypothetical protein